MNTFQIILTSLCFLLSGACNENMLPRSQREPTNACADSLVVYKQELPPGNLPKDLDGNIIAASTISYRLFLYADNTSLAIDSIVLANKKLTNTEISRVTQKPVYGGAEGKEVLVGETDCVVTQARFSYSGQMILTPEQQNDLLIYYRKDGQAKKLKPLKVVALERMVTQ